MNKHGQDASNICGDAKTADVAPDGKVTIVQG